MEHLGGSCYYFANITSKSSYANYICNDIRSNHSNLMQIRHVVELFYVAQVLTKNHLSILGLKLIQIYLKVTEALSFLRSIKIKEMFFFR